MKDPVMLYRCTMLRQDPDLPIIFDDRDTTTLVLIKRNALVHTLTLPAGTHYRGIFQKLHIKLKPVHFLKRIFRRAGSFYQAAPAKAAA